MSVIDVDEIIEHVINANMLCMPYHVYSELFDAVDGLGVEIENLQSENAKLREELADAPKCDACEAMLDCDECLRADGSHKERRRLSAENAKLQKLVQDMWFWIYCENVCQKSDKEQAVIIADIIARMGELGVEPKFTEEDE